MYIYICILLFLSLKATRSDVLYVLPEVGQQMTETSSPKYQL